MLGILLQAGSWFLLCGLGLVIIHWSMILSFVLATRQPMKYLKHEEALALTMHTHRMQQKHDQAKQS